MADTPNKIEKIYYPGLDTLRGLAILMVLIYHNFPIIPHASFGSLGVDLFFVLSGFLITDILLRAKNDQKSLKNFYIRRILRIFPIYFSTLLFFLFILPATYRVIYDVQYYRHNQHWFYMFIQNYLFIIKPAEKTRFLYHFWSLAVEEQFYLIWPIFIFFTVKKNRLIPPLICVFVFVCLARIALLFFCRIDNLFYIVSRFDGLLAGSLLAIFLWHGFTITKQLLTIILVPLVMINLSFFLLVKEKVDYFPFCGYTTFSILFGLLAYYVITNKSIVKGTSLAGKILRFFGKISYGLYIYHWPVFVLLSHPVQNMIFHFFHLPYSCTFLLASIIISVAGIILSVLSYRYFEKIFLSLKKRYPQ